MEEKDSTTIRRAVINKAIGFIFDNMEEEIAVDDVAKHCGYSKYHLMRMFKEDTDEALYQFIKRVRLERSTLIFHLLTFERSVSGWWRQALFQTVYPWMI